MKNTSKLLYSIFLLFFTIMIITIDYLTFQVVFTGKFEFNIKNIIISFPIITFLLNVLLMAYILDYLEEIFKLKNDMINIGDQVKYQYNDGVYYRKSILTITDKCKDEYIIENEDIKIKVSRDYIMNNRIDK